MSPAEFSNYIKQRAMQQQMHTGHGVVSSTASIPSFSGSDMMSPTLSISPNPNALGNNQHTGTLSNSSDPFYYSNMGVLYPQFRSQRNLFESHFSTDNVGLFASGATASASKYSKYLEPCYFPNSFPQSTAVSGQLGQIQPVGTDKSSITENCFGIELDVDCGLADVAVFRETKASNTVSASTVVTSAVSAAAAAAAVIITIAGEKSPGNKASDTSTVGVVPSLSATAAAAAAVTTATYSSGQPQQSQGSSSVTNSKLINGISSFYSTGSSYQQLLLAN